MTLLELIEALQQVHLEVGGETEVLFFNGAEYWAVSDVRVAVNSEKQPTAVELS